MSLRSPYYLDYNAGAPLHPSVMERLRHFSALTGNPSSVHSFGQKLAVDISRAKKNILKTFSASTETKEDDLIFCGSGTEAAQFVWETIRLAQKKSGTAPHWVVSEVEHKATLDCSNRAEYLGEEVTRLKVKSDGSLESFEIPKSSALSLHWVNNETGIVWPMKDIVAQAKKAGAWVHVDACQVWGKMPFDVMELGADFVTFSAHKIGALSGTGLVWVNPKHRSKIKTPKTGTLNVFGVLACGEAALHLPSRDQLGKWSETQKEFEAHLKSKIKNLVVNGEKQSRVPNTTHITITGLKKAQDLVVALDMAGFAVSAGSACSAGIIEPSHVVTALGYSKTDALNSIRISYGPQTKLEDLKKLTEALAKII